MLSNARQLHVLGFGPRYHSGPLPGAWCLRELKDELTAAVEALANAMESLGKCHANGIKMNEHWPTHSVERCGIQKLGCNA